MCSLRQQRWQQISSCQSGCSQQLQSKHHHAAITYISRYMPYLAVFRSVLFPTTCTSDALLLFAMPILMSCAQASHLQEKDNFALLEQARIIYSAGFFLTASAESMLLAAKHAAANNKIYCVNISAPFLLQVRCHSVPLVPQEAFTLAAFTSCACQMGACSCFAQHKQHNQ